jgi:hypothetical protein
MELWKKFALKNNFWSAFGAMGEANFALRKPGRRPFLLKNEVEFVVQWFMDSTDSRGPKGRGAVPVKFELITINF